MKAVRGISQQVHRSVVGLVIVAAQLAAAQPFERARELYQRTDYEAASKVLLGMAQKDAKAYHLLGMCYYMEGDPKRAGDAFGKAVQLEPGQSDYYLWLGRAFGRRAETSSFLTAPVYASKARTYFETAVSLDPRNMEAISDLFEFYLDAPGILGGGLDKAAAMAERMARLNPAEGHWAQARLAEKRREYRAAEEQLRRAVDLAPRQAGRLVDLAKLLAKAGQYQESEEAFRRAESLAPGSPKILFARASVYIESGRNIELAKRLLRQYLAAPLTPDDPPRKDAERLLRQISAS
jgi:cytochrome c-type biogenesis protein CcmH/NrfG